MIFQRTGISVMNGFPTGDGLGRDGKPIHVGDEKQVKKPCPMCKGRPVVTMQTDIRDRACELCGGRGYVEPELMCRCGRPAVIPVNGTVVCTRNACIDKACNKKEMEFSTI